MNGFKTFILMLAMTLLIVVAGSLIGGRNGMLIALFFAGVMNFVSYWFSDRIVLAMYGAKEIKENDFPQIHKIVSNLSLAGGLPKPKLYYINMAMPNAFATGRDPQHAAVAVTKGIIELLDENELSGVLAHELSHIKNRDILIGTIAATAAGAVFMLARMAQFAAIFGGAGRGGGGGDRGGNVMGALAVAIIAPIAAMIIQMAISRQREYLADKSGAKMLGNPLALASALNKLSAGVKRNPAEVNPVTAHMFIMNPFSGKSLLTIFSTHPPLEERIKRLENMAQENKGYKIPKIVY